MMLRLSTRGGMSVAAGIHWRFAYGQFFLKRWPMPHCGGVTQNLNFVIGPPSQQCAYHQTNAHQGKHFNLPRKVKERIKYQNSNEQLFNREKILRSLNDSEVKESAGLSECLKGLNEQDEFGTLVTKGDDDGEGKSGMSNRGSAEQPSQMSSRRSAGKRRRDSELTKGDVSRLRNARHSKDFTTGAPRKTANVADRFGTYSVASGSRETMGWKSIDAGIRSRGINHSSPSQQFGEDSLAVVDMGHDAAADEFGTIADDFEEAFLRPGPITTANVELRRDEASEAHDDFHLRLSKYGRRHEQNWYERRIEKLAKDGQVLGALDFLEKTMIEKDRVMPTAFAYTVVINAMAKYGYPQGAFRLFRKMLSYKLTPYDHTYTALFNACANCPDKAIALKYASRFRETLSKKDILPNRTTYKAMMKAYAMIGDLQTTFALVDELYEKRGRLDHDSFSHMLMGAISDKEAGFKHAVEVFRAMRKHGQKPSLTHYNLLLRAMRDCGVGSQEFFHQLLGSGASAAISDGAAISQVQKSLGRNDPKLIAVSTEQASLKDSNELSENLLCDDTEVTEQKDRSFLAIPPNLMSQIPDILSPNPDTSQMISITDIKTSRDRLELVGGIPGLLANMQRDDVTPDVRTFTVLLDVMPSDKHVEDMLIATLGELKVEPDVGFFNILMRKRVFRNDVRGARAVLDHLITYNLSPDIKTFGILALTCRVTQNAFALIGDMKKLGLEPTPEILSHLGRASRYDFDYKLALIFYMQKNNIKPNEHFLQYTEKTIKDAKRYVVDKERGQEVPKLARSDKFNIEFGTFLKSYKTWLLSMGIEKPDPYWKMFKDHQLDRKEAEHKAKEEKKSVFLRELGADTDTIK